jgi:hypothetical protein
MWRRIAAPRSRHGLGTSTCPRRPLFRGAFPAVAVDDPDGRTRWYYDGGARLNTPLKPALSLHADPFVVSGLNSITIGGSLA